MRALSFIALSLAFAACSLRPEEEARQTRTVTVEVGPVAAQAGDAAGERAPEAAGEPPPAVPGDGECDNARAPTTERNLRQAEIAIRCLTNAARRQQGLDELGFDERLARAAATRSNDMAKANYFGHDGPDGSNVRAAVQRMGWIPSRKSWLLGENIGWAPKGSATPADLVRSWLNSPTHRANMLSRDYSEMGVGAIAAVPEQGAAAGATFTQIFGVTGDRARRAQTS